MFSIAEQFSSATKSQLASQIKLINSFAGTAVTSVEQVIALNLSTAKASLEHSSSAAKQLLQAKDPQEFIKLSSSAPASLESLLAYGSELFSIASKAQAELFRAAQLPAQPVAAVLKLAAPASALEVAVDVAAAPLQAEAEVAVAELAAIEVAAPASAPTSASISEPVSEPISEPISEPVSAPISASFSEPVGEPVSEPVVEALKPAPLKPASSGKSKAYKHK